MITVLGLLGASALYLLFAWLASAIVASYISERKGYGERPGLASGLLLNALGIVIWLLWPAKPDSKWKQLGPFKRQSSDRPAVEPRTSPPGQPPGTPPSADTTAST